MPASACSWALAANSRFIPNRSNVIQSIFTPSDEQIAAAQRLIAGARRAASAGHGAFAFEGKMIDMPAIRAAQQVLAKARAAGKI